MSNLRIPSKFIHNVDAHKKWLSIIELAELTVDADAQLQKAAANGLHLKERSLPPEVLGRSYARYCYLVNQVYDAYLNSVHLQRAPYMLELITVFVKRMYELRSELVHLIVNDYIYVDSALAQLRMTPLDIQIVVPYHFPLESRSDNIEQVLQKMWADAIRRKRIRERPPKEPSPGLTLDGEKQQEPAEDTLSAEEDTVSLPPSIHTYVPEEFIQAVLLQRHERFRQWYMKDFREKSAKRKTYYGPKLIEPSEVLKNRAARIVQLVYREYMKIKRERVRDTKRDILLGLIPDPFRSGPSFREENNKVYERRRNTRLKIKPSYLKELEKENIRLIVFKKEGQIEDITDEIRTWFKEWYYGYGFFPEYPYEVEGGTLMVVRGDYPSVDEKIAHDEKQAALTKGKTKDQIKEEKAQAKAEAQLKAKALQEAKKKNAEVLLKLRCNPLSDPGYKPQESHVMEKLIHALQHYRAAWSLYDDLPPERYGEAIYGFMKPLITEDLMSALHKDCRKFVDEMMRLDLKLLIQMHQAMFKRVGWTYPKVKPRPQPKHHPLPKSFVVDKKLLKNIEQVFDLGIVTKPTTKISDIYGDSKYGAYELNIKDPDAKFPLPGYGDIKSRLLLSCVFGCGIQHGAPRKRAVMLLGPERNGKSFLVDAVAGELNAVKIDITPEVFSALLEKPSKELAQVFLAARAFQPAVIFMKNVERVYAKKVQPHEKYLQATLLKAPLAKLINNLHTDDKVIFIATCTDPFAAARKPMVNLFDEIILVPRTDYGSLQQFYYEKLMRIKSMPRDFPMQPLAQMVQGYGFGVVIEAYNDVMTPERIVRLNVDPLSPGEIMEALMNKGLEPTTLDDYQKYVDFFLKNSSLGPEREDYEKINFSRDDAYKKMEKKMEKQKLAERAASRTSQH